MNTLKRCPFCNGRAVIETRERNNGVGFYVRCCNCGLQTYEAKVEDDEDDNVYVGRAIRCLVMTWNDRAVNTEGRVTFGKNRVK